MAKEGREDCLKPNTKKIYTDFFSKQLPTMTNATPKSTQIRQEPLHITNTSPSTFSENHTNTLPPHTTTNTTPQSYIPSQLLHYTHTQPRPLTLTHITTVTHAHTLTPTTVSCSHNSNHPTGAYFPTPSTLQRCHSRRAGPPQRPRPVSNATEQPRSPQTPPPCPAAGTR